ENIGMLILRTGNNFYPFVSVNINCAHAQNTMIERNAPILPEGTGCAIIGQGGQVFTIGGNDYLNRAILINIFRYDVLHWKFHVVASQYLACYIENVEEFISRTY